MTAYIPSGMCRGRRPGTKRITSKAIIADTYRYIIFHTSPHPQHTINAWFS
jgi:hypothetical protein